MSYNPFVLPVQMCASSFVMNAAGLICFYGIYFYVQIPPKAFSYPDA